MFVALTKVLLEVHTEKVAMAQLGSADVAPNNKQEAPGYLRQLQYLHSL